MQAVQRVNGYADEDAAANADPNSLPINAPNLTYAQVRSLFTGSLTDWADVHSGITDAGNGSTFAKVCRRVVTELSDPERLSFRQHLPVDHLAMA